MSRQLCPAHSVYDLVQSVEYVAETTKRQPVRDGKKVLRLMELRMMFRVVELSIRVTEKRVFKINKKVCFSFVYCNK